MLSALVPSVPRKTSGAVSSASDGVVAIGPAAATSLLFLRMVARWLALDAARVFLARIDGLAAIVVLSFRPAAEDPTAFTALVAVSSF